MPQIKTLPQSPQFVSRLIGLAIALSVFATVVSAADLPQSANPPIQMYPEIDIEFTVEDTIAAIVVEVSNQRPYHPVAKTTITRTADGRLAATLACPFLGSGVLRVFDAAAAEGSAPLIETAVSCLPEGTPVSETAPVPLAQVQSAAAAPAPDPSVTTWQAQ